MLLLLGSLVTTHKSVVGVRVLGWGMVQYEELRILFYSLVLKVRVDILSIFIISEVLER